MLDKKYKRLQNILKKQKSAIIAFSGGVDSSLLAKVALDVLGSNALAVTVNSEVISKGELKHAKKIAKKIGIQHIVVKTDLMKNANFTENNPLRCYYCKKQIMKLLKEIATERGIGAVMDGTNFDDLHEERPGLKVLKNEGITSPLAEAGIGKSDVRELAKKLELPDYERESNTCLATRIPHGERITVERLKKIELAEGFIKKFGVKGLRVRDHGNLARIEVNDESIPLILSNRGKINRKLKSIGYEYVTLNIR